ncbi:MAG TPA: chaperone NapD [Rhodocyclaceae bacterium]
MNISSAIVNARPGALGAVSNEMAAMAGVEIHAAADDRLIVTIEAEDNRATADIFESLGRIAGVLSISMVYHQVEADPEGYLAQA